METTVFNKENIGSVRAIVIDNKPYFYSKDVYMVIGTRCSYDYLLNRLVDRQNGKAIFDNGDYVIVISIQAVYEFINSDSYDDRTEIFKNWFADEIVPIMVVQSLGMNPEKIESLEWIKCYQFETREISDKPSRRDT